MSDFKPGDRACKRSLPDTVKPVVPDGAACLVAVPEQNHSPHPARRNAW
jgi:hypothetical protein